MTDYVEPDYEPPEREHEDCPYCGRGSCSGRAGSSKCGIPEDREWAESPAEPYADPAEVDPDAPVRGCDRCQRAYEATGGQMTQCTAHGHYR